MSHSANSRESELEHIIKYICDTPAPPMPPYEQMVSLIPLDNDSITKNPNSSQPIRLPIIRYAASLAACFICLITLLPFLFTSSGQNVLADGIANIQDMDSVQFLIRMEGETNQFTSVQCVLHKGMIRNDYSHGLTTILDSSSMKQLWLYAAPKTKKDRSYSIPLQSTLRKVAAKPDPNDNAVRSIPNPIDRLKDLNPKDATFIEMEIIDGIRASHFRSKTSSFNIWESTADNHSYGFQSDIQLDVWISDSDKLPCRIELSRDSKSPKIIYEKIRWSEPVDAALLKLTTPEGYETISPELFKSILNIEIREVRE